MSSLTDDIASTVNGDSRNAQGQKSPMYSNGWFYDQNGNYTQNESDFQREMTRAAMATGNTMYGRTSTAFQEEANRSLGAANQRAAAFGGMGTTALQRGQTIGTTAQNQAMRGQEGAQFMQDRAGGYQNTAMGAGAALGGMSADERAQAQSSLASLRNFYQQGPGPSAAEAQMRQGADANMAQSIALAHSGRGAGANANAMRSAAFQNAATGQQLNQSLGTLRANEAANWRGQQLQAMGAEQQGWQGLRAQDIAAQGQEYGLAGQMGQQGLGYGQLGLGYQQTGNQAQLGFEGMGNQNNLGFQTLGQSAAQSGEDTRRGIYGMQQQSDTARYGADKGVQVGMAQVEQGDRAANYAMAGSLLAAMSDVRAKKDIEPADMSRVFGNGGPDLRAAQGYEYNYKDPSAPGAAPGRQVGPMAQNLPASVVDTGADGKKRVDPGRLTLVNTAAVSELQRRTDELEALLNRRAGNAPGEQLPGPTQPASNIGFHQSGATGLEAMQQGPYGLPTDDDLRRRAFAR